MLGVAEGGGQWAVHAQLAQNAELSRNPKQRLPRQVLNAAQHTVVVLPASRRAYCCGMLDVLSMRWQHRQAQGPAPTLLLSWIAKAVAQWSCWLA